MRACRAFASPPLFPAPAYRRHRARLQARKRGQSGLAPEGGALASTHASAKLKHRFSLDCLQNFSFPSKSVNILDRKKANRCNELRTASSLQAESASAAGLRGVADFPPAVQPGGTGGAPFQNLEPGAIFKKISRSSELFHRLGSEHEAIWRQLITAPRPNHPAVQMILDLIVISQDLPAPRSVHRACPDPEMSCWDREAEQQVSARRSAAAR
nr:PREDICTED: uncharacterized protein LOC109437680 [Rhinolophus sinicus]